MKCSITLALALGLTINIAPAASWLTDMNAAQEQARTGNKLILVNFTGSDWCGWCIKLKNEVFSKPEFGSFADQNLVLLEIDFPRSKPMSAEVKKANGKLADKYKVGGYPSVHVLDAEGKSLGQLGYMPGGPGAFLGKVKSIAGKRLPAAPVVTKTKEPAAETPAVEVAETPAFNGAPTFPPKEYSDLELKGISGSGNSRFALINNQTVSVGESAKVKLGDSVVKVKCLEIHDDSVIVSLDGASDRRRLRLRGGL